MLKVLNAIKVVKTSKLNRVLNLTNPLMFAMAVILKVVVDLLKNTIKLGKHMMNDKNINNIKKYLDSNDIKKANISFLKND